MSQFETVLVYPRCSPVIIIYLSVALRSVSMQLTSFIASLAVEPAEMQEALKKSGRWAVGPDGWV